VTSPSAMIVFVASPTPRNPTPITKEKALPVMAKGEVPKPYLSLRCVSGRWGYEIAFTDDPLDLANAEFDEGRMIETSAGSTSVADR
jgi:hypothetical protein